MSTVVDNILRGPEPLYEPVKGGLGYEIFQMLKLNSGKVALKTITTEETVTYDDLLDKSIKVAIYLAEKNLRRGDIVCVLSENSSNSMIPLIVTQFIGLKYIAIEPSLPEEDLLYLFDYLEIKIIFVSERLEKRIVECVTRSSFKGEVIILGKSQKFTDLSQLMKISEGIETFQPIYIDDIKEDAVIALSSGTTGKPKGICISHYALLGQVFNHFTFFGKGTIHFSNFEHSETKNPDKLKFLLYAPLNWISSILISLITFFSGGSIIFGTTFNAEEAWFAIKKYEPNMLFLPPGQMNELCSYVLSKEEHSTTLNCVLTGGGLVSKIHIQNMKKCFPEAVNTQCYGQTENVGNMASFKINKPEDVELTRNFPESCGRISSGSQVRIVDPDNETICGVRQQGELRIKNKFSMNGYYKMDSSSAFDSDGWFRTGDIAYFDEIGCIYIIDRIKDQLLYKLYNIRPSVIEKILYSHPAVHEALVIGYPHPQDNEHPMGIVVLKDEYKHKITADELITYVNEKVPSDRYKIRAGIKFVDELLKTVTGKPKKIEMKKLLLDNKLETV